MNNYANMPTIRTRLKASRWIWYRN